jgi:HAE1 family hydrophobic/amphiphilic exporter-1
MLSKFFIERPVLANVIAILTLVIGAVALFRLPVAQYPDVVPPTVQVSTRYPGASARTVIDTVALPIEQQVNGVEGMIYMQSFAGNDGTYTLTVTFNIGTPLDYAQVLVQNRVSSALSQLPQAVQNQGVNVEKKSTAILQIVTLTSTNHDSLFLANYATINLKDQLARLPGVGNVAVFGAGQYAMRVWLDPEKMKARNLSIQDVIQSLQQQNTQVAAGQAGTPPNNADPAFQYTLNVAGRLTSAEQFGDVILKAEANGRKTRVRDVGLVELGAQSYSQIFTLGGKPAAGVAIFQLPGANALNVAGEVKAKMAELARDFPQGVVQEIPFDVTKFVDASVQEVYKTLIEAAFLVLIVILVFLQDWRAMLVPATTVPITIIGAFAAMAALGFTVNFATLFAIVLAIGIVVDDAIIVAEGAAHNLDQGMNSKDAAIEAMRVLFAPIVGITLVLLSVFLPAAFISGLTGQMYAQFALVIAATALISAVNAVTLKPTQCALWMRPSVPVEQRNVLYRMFDRGYASVERGYTALMRHMVRFAGIMVVIALAIVAGALYGFTRLPTGFLPIEDQGYMIASVQLPDGAALNRTQQTLTKVADTLSKVPGVDKVITIAGVSPIDNSASLANAGVAYVVLKDWSVRGTAQGLLPMIINLNKAVEGIQEATVRVLPPPPIQGIGLAGGFTMQVQLRDGSFDFAKLQRVVDTMVANAAAQSSTQLVMSSFRADVPQYSVEVDRTKVESLGLTVDQVFSTLSGYFGSSFVNQFNQFGRTFQVYVQAESKFRLSPEGVNNLAVRNADGQMIPLGTLVTLEPANGPALISLYNLYPSATIIGMPARGYSSGQLMTMMEQLAKETLPSGMAYEWTAMSYQEKIVGNQIYYVFALALLLVYLVLAGQYESWFKPVSVILSVPIALLGPVVVIKLLNIDNNLYTQIGLVLLVALSAKNAILIVEFARELHDKGMSAVEAAVEAARERFRPIIMTSFAFILGVVPLVLATGAGANARASIGITVFSGMLASTCIAILFLPSMYVIVQRFEDWWTVRGSRRAAKPAPADGGSGVV